MKRVFFSILFVLLILTLQAESQTHPVTIDLNGSPTGSSSISLTVVTPLTRGIRSVGLPIWIPMAMDTTTSTTGNRPFIRKR